MDLIRKFLSYLRNNYLPVFITVLVLIIAVVISSCQGLVNANGSDNSIVFNRQNQEVRVDG